jgi:hypothetical protein
VHGIHFLGNEAVGRNSVGEIHIQQKYEDGRQPERELVAAIEEEESYGAARSIILNGQAEERIVPVLDHFKQALIILKNFFAGLGDC